MKEYQIVKMLGKAWGNTSKANNCFLNTINKIKWDNIYKTQDGTTEYVIGGLSIEVEKMSPFETTFRPMFMSNKLGVGTI